MLSRTGLLAELQSKGILNLVPAEVKQIHALLEADFNPLELCRKLVRHLGSDCAASPVSPTLQARSGSTVAISAQATPLSRSETYRA